MPAIGNLWRGGFRPLLRVATLCAAVVMTCSCTSSKGVEPSAISAMPDRTGSTHGNAELGIPHHVPAMVAPCGLAVESDAEVPDNSLIFGPVAVASGKLLATLPPIYGPADGPSRDTDGYLHFKFGILVKNGSRVRLDVPAADSSGNVIYVNNRAASEVEYQSCKSADGHSTVWVGGVGIAGYLPTCFRAAVITADSATATYRTLLEVPLGKPDACL